MTNGEITNPTVFTVSPAERLSLVRRQLEFIIRCGDDISKNAARAGLVEVAKIERELEQCQNLSN